MAFEVSREVLPDKAFLIASVQMAPQLKCWQPVWGDRLFLISSFYDKGETRRAGLGPECAQREIVDCNISNSQASAELLFIQ